MKEFPLLMYMDVAIMCLHHASSHTNTIVRTTPFSVSKSLKYSGTMKIASKLVTIATSFYGVGYINNQVVVVGFKVLVKHVVVMGAQVATL